MSIEDNLKDLTDNELVVLKMRCRGKKIAEIAAELSYSDEWVWGQMGSIYAKLKFDKKMHWKQRVRILKEQVCPLLDKIPEIPSAVVLVPQPEPEPDPEMLALVKLDERELLKQETVLVKPINLESPRRRPVLAIALISVCFLGIVVLSVLGYFYYPIALALMATQTPNIIGVPVIISATPLPSPIVQDTATLAGLDIPLPQDTAPSLPTDTAIPPPTSSSVLFTDHFTTGLDPAWITLSGQPQIVQNALTASEESWLQLSNPSWKNVKITITATGSGCWFNGPFNEIGVGESPNDMVAFAWAGCESAWGIVSSGEWQQVANSHADGVGFDKYTLTVTFKDNSYTASAPTLFETKVILPDKSSVAQNIFFRVGRDTQTSSFRVEEIP